MLSLGLVAILGAQIPAQIGKPYLIGTVGRTKGEKQVSELGNSRVVTIKSARTAIAFGTKKETIVAGEGKKLVILEANIRNPEKRAISVTESQTFGLRVYDTKFTVNDVQYRGAAAKELSLLSKTLKPGESIDIVTIYEFPAKTPHLRIGIFYHTYIRSQAPKIDLTAQLTPPASVFAESVMNYVPTAEASLGARFDLDDLQFKVLGQRKIEQDGTAVRVEITNPMPRPGRWGWQYATAAMLSGATTVNSYPEFYIDPQFQTWGNEIRPGATVVGEYRFYPPAGFSAKQFRLQMNATKRTVSVGLGP